MDWPDNLSRRVASMTPRDWLVRLNAAVRNPQSSKEFEMRLAAIATGCGELPAEVWSEGSLARAMRAEWCRFWPSVAELHAHLEAEARTLSIERIRLRFPDKNLSDTEIIELERACRWAATSKDPDWVKRIYEQSFDPHMRTVFQNCMAAFERADEAVGGAVIPFSQKSGSAGVENIMPKSGTSG